MRAKSTQLFIALVAASVLISPAAAKNVCGDGKGEVCGSWFSTYSCDKAGACCHDDFNAWCCPPNYVCNGNTVFHDPGGNTHCLTEEKMSKSCKWNPEIVDPDTCADVSEVTGAWSMTLPEITAGDDSVVFTTGTTKTYSESATDTWGVKVTATVGAGLSVLGTGGKATLSAEASASFASTYSSSFSETKTKSAASSFSETGVGWQWMFTITDDCGEAYTYGPGFPIVTPNAATPPCCLPGYFVIGADGVRDNYTCLDGSPNLCTDMCDDMGDLDPLICASCDGKPVSDA